MGRTNPTYRDWLRGFEQRWQPFRRALRRRDRPAFDRLCEQARGHADAAGHANATQPEIALVLSVLLAHERRLAALEGESDGGGNFPVDDTENRLADDAGD